MPANESKAEPSVMVFAPTPILTVTIEHGIEGTPEVHLHAGSQGFWVARMIASLGVPVTMCSPFGNDSGRVLRTLIEAEGVTVRAVHMHGANGAYVHDRRGGERVEIANVPSVELTRHEIDDLYDAALIAGLAARVTVLTGPTPETPFPSNVYRRLATDIRTNGGHVIADLSGEQLNAVLEGGVDILKISHEELIQGGFAADNDPGSVLGAMGQLVSGGARSILVSRAADPAFARTGNTTVEIIVPKFEPNEFRGSGDSMTAGLATGLARGLEMDATLRLGAAAGALNVTRSGLGTGHRDEIEQLSQRIEIRPLTVGEPDGH